MKSTERGPRVLMLGATSGIAERLARIYAAEGASLFLVARRKDRLDAVAADLLTRGSSEVRTLAMDLAVPVDFDAELRRMADPFGGFDHIIIAFGILGDQATAERDPVAARQILDVDFSAPAAWALAAADHLTRLGRGSLVVLGSVAGDRGRRANFIYGSAKAGLEVFVQGLAHRAAGRGPRIVLVKPGPTDTPMTAGMKKGGLLWSSAERVAATVRRAADAGGPVVYAPWFWRPLMAVIRLLPAAVFNRLNV